MTRAATEVSLVTIEPLWPRVATVDCVATGFGQDRKALCHDIKKLCHDKVAKCVLTSARGSAHDRCKVRAAACMTDVRARTTHSPQFSVAIGFSQLSVTTKNSLLRQSLLSLMSRPRFCVVTGCEAGAAKTYDDRVLWVRHSSHSAHDCACSVRIAVHATYLLQCTVWCTIWVTVHGQCP